MGLTINRDREWNKRCWVKQLRTCQSKQDLVATAFCLHVNVQNRTDFIKVRKFLRFYWVGFVGILSLLYKLKESEKPSIRHFLLNHTGGSLLPSWLPALIQVQRVQKSTHKALAGFTFSKKIPKLHLCMWKKSIGREKLFKTFCRERYLFSY